MKCLRDEPAYKIASSWRISKNTTASIYSLPYARILSEEEQETLHHELVYLYTLNVRVWPAIQRHLHGPVTSRSGRLCPLVGMYCTYIISSWWPASCCLARGTVIDLASCLPLVFCVFLFSNRGEEEHIQHTILFRDFSEDTMFFSLALLLLGAFNLKKLPWKAKCFLSCSLSLLSLVIFHMQLYLLFFHPSRIEKNPDCWLFTKFSRLK